MWNIRNRTDKSDTEKEVGGEAGTSQSHSRYKKGYMTNIYLTDLDKEIIVDFMKDHEELCDKTNDHFKDKARKACLCERVANSQTCLSRYATRGLGGKGHIMASSCNPSLDRPQKR